MTPIKNYILLVDSHRRPGRCRNTRGRYRVGAKNEKEAVEFLRDRIGFGSIQVYYECSKKTEPSYRGPVLKRGEIKQEISGVDENGKVVHLLKEPHHATAPRSSYMDDEWLR